MFRSRLAFTLGAAALMVAAPLGNFPAAPFLGSGTAQAQQVSVSFSVFFDNLAPHGRWVRNSHYHYVWCPAVERTWAPYTHGHWIYLDGRGWYFASDEPFAWAAYHYGRWYRDADIGWCWVPGTVWAPACRSHASHPARARQRKPLRRRIRRRVPSLAAAGEERELLERRFRFSGTLEELRSRLLILP